MMKQNKISKQLDKFVKIFSIRASLQNRLEKILLLVLLLVFTAYVIFLSTNLQTGIIPDETYRFEVSTYFAETWGIPNDVPVAYTSGDNLHRNPFLGYWIYGRVIQITMSLYPNASEWQILVVLRLFNGLFAIGTAIITYIIAKELISKKWWPLLPVFLLTHTLMFVFLSAGVNHDNPTIFLCTLGTLYFGKTLSGKSFLINSILWMLCIFTAALIKYAILPLAFVMIVVWVIYLIKNRNNIKLKPSFNIHFITLSALLLAVLGINVFIYGVNLVKFQSLTPSCTDTFPLDVCQNSFFGQRHAQLALPEKLSVFQAFRQGYPEPIRYVFDEWIRLMLDRTFGIMGEVNYFPINIVYFHIALYWMIFLAARYIRTLSFNWFGLLVISIFYAMVLIWMNYNSELTYGFYKYVALQGRYIFPVISLIYILCTFVLTQVTNRWIKLITLLVSIMLFIYSGPIRFIWYYQSVFADWFI